MTSSGLRGESKAASVSFLTKDQMTEMIRLQSESRLVGIQRVVRVGEFTMLSSERNATPLFGAGLIDAIDAREIEAAAVEQDRSAGSSEIRGRVSRLPDGRVGRFGWKGQMASLDDFVLNACAVELGLEVPDHPQAIDPLAPEEPRTGGLDLTGRDCAALTAYVASLPAPIERAPAGKQEAARIAEGRDRFASIGCAACHRPKLGQVAGIYSDLLLHDMGPGLGDSGSYGVSSPDSPGLARPRTPAPLADATRPGGGAGRTGPAAGPTRQEWRTPPLWGLRDSGPYLHDGRAATLEQAIAAHAGEAQKTAQRFFALAPSERSELLTFLKSLVAPTTQLARQ
jgi:CxxC motif-containing protein (DUF1111 family)